jgi:hypothetical protein
MDTRKYLFGRMPVDEVEEIKIYRVLSAVGIAFESLSEMDRARTFVIVLPIPSKHPLEEIHLHRICCLFSLTLLYAKLCNTRVGIALDRLWCKLHNVF